MSKEKDTLSTRIQFLHPSGTLYILLLANLWYVLEAGELSD